LARKIYGSRSNKEENVLVLTDMEMLLDFRKEKVKSLGESKIMFGTLEENLVWLCTHGNK
jgi:hypothetical protein